jgi:dCMP deaminase
MRKNWDDFFMAIAELVGEQSTCLRRHVGAVIVKDKRMLSTGYNGAPSGISHCETRGCLRQNLGIPSGERYELCYAAHAEQNAINNAAKYGVAINGTVLYCTDYPCAMCAKSIVNSGITTVIYKNGPVYDMSKEILAGIKTIQLVPTNE